ncbi:HAD-IC family P-type ATPase [Furfurilactobacillus curtus]|uniref:Proton-efflux P-type ATPase n=1 Tax=Furfurilactobacillus curtus TaxID=1746200 RepID=A0ABQ5JTS1_9LACO
MVERIQINQQNNFQSLEQSYVGQGLSDQERLAERNASGDNRMVTQGFSWRQSLLTRLWGPIPWLLEFAIIFEIGLGKWIQALVVIGLLLFSAIDGAIQERRAQRALKIVQTDLVTTSRVLIDQHWQSRTSDELVVGDLIHLTAGDLVPADLRIVAGQAQVDQSAVTGETVAESRRVGETLTAASLIVTGDIIAQVSAVGAASSYGRTVTLTQTAAAPGRLERLLFTVVRYLAYLDAGLTVLLVIGAVIYHMNWQEILPLLVILIIATIPVSMPSSFTVANAVEAQVLAKKHILVTGLSGIQEAGTMDVLLVDKTGTLTKNQQQLVSVVPVGDVKEAQLIQWAKAATNPQAKDAISLALKQATKAVKLPFEIQKQLPFNATTKVAQAIISDAEITETVTLGAPQAILKTVNPKFTDETMARLAKQGQRVLALSIENDGQPQLAGWLGFSDTIRSDTAEQLRALRSAGIRVVMLTGDDRLTAQAIGHELGLSGKYVAGGFSDDGLDHLVGIANVYPDDKQRLVKQFQQAGHVVGMIGDGVNDAAALRQADVGMAVANARDIAKLAARVVLAHAGLDDVLTVVNSGRRVYQRMMTWTITKLSRTAVLTALLTLGFLLTGTFPISLSLIVVIVVLNDLVTLVLGTDQTVALSTTPRWTLPRVAKLAMMLASGWLVVGLGIVGLNHWLWHASAGWLSSILFMYLMFSSMMTILMTRTNQSWWQNQPSRSVAGMIGFDVILTSVIAASGWQSGAVSWSVIGLMILLVVLVGTGLDVIKQHFYQQKIMNRGAT